MSMEHLILCCICVSALLRLATSGEISTLLLTPDKLHLGRGQTATFTCNFKALNFTLNDINWYKKENDTQIKIADLTSGKQNERLKAEIDKIQKKVYLQIKNVELNDSSKYYCGHVSIANNSIVFVSNISELIVENLQYMATTGTALTKESPNKKPQSSNVTIIATSIAIVLLLLVLIAAATIVVRPKQRNKTPQPHLRPSEMPHQEPEIYSVDYGVLDFGSSTPSRKSTDTSVLEQVEYAVIMFPQGTPCMGEQRLKKA